MPLQVIVLGRIISFTSEYPANAEEYFLYGSRCFYAAGIYGTILAQYLPLDGFESQIILSQKR